MEYNTEPEETSNNMTEDIPPTKEIAMNGVDENGHDIVSKQACDNSNDDFGDFGVANGGETGDVVNNNDEGGDDNDVTNSTKEDEVENNDTDDVPGLVTDEQAEAGHADSTNDDEIEKNDIETDDEFKAPFASGASSPPQAENNFLGIENAAESGNEEFAEDEKINVNEKEAEQEVGTDPLDFGTEATSEEPSQPISILNHSGNVVSDIDGVEGDELMNTVENSPSAQDNFGEPLSAEPAATPDESDKFIAFGGASKLDEAISPPAEVSTSVDFGDFGETGTAKSVSNESAATPEDGDNFDAFGDSTKLVEESKPPEVEADQSDDFGDFGEPVSTEPSAVPEDGDNLDAFGDSAKLVEESTPPEVEASASDDFGDFGESVSAEPAANPEDGDNLDAFGDSAKPAESEPPAIVASQSDDFGDFGEPVSAEPAATPEDGDNFDAFGDSTKPAESGPPAIVASQSDDFGDFGEPVSAEPAATPEDGDNFDAFGDSTKPAESGPPAIVASRPDDFGDFGEPVSTEPATNPEDGDNFDAFGDSTEPLGESTPPEVQASASDDFGGFDEPVSAEAVPNTEGKDDFGDFGDSTIPTEATPPVVSGDFGDFGEPVESESKALPQAEDDFDVSREADEEDTLDQPEKVRRVATQAVESTPPVDDDDDFGDFGEFDEAEVSPASEEKQKPADEMSDDDFGDFGDFDEAQSGTPVQEAEENNTQQATQPTASVEENEFSDFGTFDESDSVPRKDPLLEKSEAIFLTAFSKYGTDNGDNINSPSESEEHVSIGSVLTSLYDKEVSKENQQWYQSTLNAGLLDVKFLGDDKAEVIVSEMCVYPNEHHAFPGSFQRNFQPNKEEIKKIETNASLPTVPEVLSIELPTGDKVRKPAIPEGSKDFVDPSLISSATVVELPPLAVDKENESEKMSPPVSSTNPGVPLSPEAPIGRNESAEDNEDFSDFEAFGDSDVSFAPISDKMMTSSEKEQAATGEELNDDFGKFGNADSVETKTRDSGNENSIVKKEEEFGEFDDEKCSTPEVSERLPSDLDPSGTAKNNIDDDDDFGDFGGFSGASGHTELPKEEKSNTTTSGEVACADTLVSNPDQGRKSDGLNSSESPEKEDSTDGSPPVASGAGDEEFDFGNFGEAEASSRDGNGSDTKPLGAEGTQSNDHSFGDFGEAADSPVKPMPQEAGENTDNVIEASKSDEFGDFGGFEAADSLVEPLPQPDGESADNTIEASKIDEFGDFGGFVSEAQPNHANEIETDPVQETQLFVETGTVTLASSDSGIRSTEASSDQKNARGTDDNFGSFVSNVQNNMDSGEGDDDQAFGDFDAVPSDGQTTNPVVKDGQNESSEVTDDNFGGFGSFSSPTQPDDAGTKGSESAKIENSVADIGGAITSTNGMTAHQSSYHNEAEINGTTSDDFGEFGDFSDVQTEMPANNQSDPSTQVGDSLIGGFDERLPPLADAVPGIPESIDPLHNGTVDFTSSTKDTEVLESTNPAVSSAVVEDQDTDFWVFEGSSDPKVSTPEQTASQWVDVGETQQVSAPNSDFQDVPVSNADEDDFGDFGTADDPTPAIESTSRQIMPQTADMSDEFGDFEEITAAPTQDISAAPTQDINGVQEESDGFGDFEDAANDAQNADVFEQTSNMLVAPQGPASSLDENDEFGDFTSSAEPVPKEAIDIVGPFLARVPDWSYMLKTEYRAPQPSEDDFVSNENSIGIEEPLNMNGFH